MPDVPAMILPLLLMLPAKVDIPQEQPTTIPAPPAAIVPELLMSPVKVAVSTTTMPAPWVAMIEPLLTMLPVKVKSCPTKNAC